MTQQTPLYLIGIDLGTTNTVVAYADMNKPLTPDNCCIFEIEQLVAPGEVAKRPQLPSFRYHPTMGEVNPDDLLLPWHLDPNKPSPTLDGELEQVVVGEWARELGAKVDGRQVVSAKSWLSHRQVDRSADILPWPGAEGVAKVSPVLASASYLFHVRNAWNFEHPDAPMEDQEVVITIPASFDEGARALTAEAADRAGFKKIRLLEEPQAVCYDWYARQGDDVQVQLSKIKLLMVCDIGGGTTDLSLIKVTQAKDGRLELTRVGVGNHLMLGGDNVDLALAHIAEKNINGDRSAKKLSAASLSQLIQQTRIAKELLLSDNAPDKAKVTVLGSGARLIGGAKSCELSQQEVRNIALDGFFPIVDFSERPLARRSGVVEFGLPYASDPAVSKYLAEFIADHQSVCNAALDIDSTLLNPVPDAVLFNGGVFNSPVLSERSLDVLGKWRGQPVTRLENNNPNLAVAQGAVAYAKALRGAQLKIGGGSARTFFLVLDQQGEEKQAICIMPKGTEEAHELILNEQKFLLRLGEPVQFHLYSSNADHDYQAGEIINIDEQTIEEQHFISLPPLVAVLDKAKSEEVAVSLATTLTEVGTLNIECVGDDSQRWLVEFQIRKQLSSQRNKNEIAALPANYEQAVEKIEDVFGDSKKQVNPKAVKTLRIDLEKLLGKRDTWEVPVLRAMFDELLSNENHRRRSDVHERLWFNLAGFGLRPGFGYPIDEWRIEQVWKLYQQGIQFNQKTQVWIDWWTFWRRAAGGLNEEQQLQLFEDIGQYLDPKALTSRKLQAEAKQKAYEDMVKLAAALEYLPIEQKIQICDWFLKRLEKASETITSWWAVGRIASRIPFNGSLHNVIDNTVVQGWLPKILKIDWNKNRQAAFAAVLMTRMCGDRSRDIDDEWRKKVVNKLTQIKAPDSWLEMVETVKELDEAETKKVYGEGLPAGLTLIC
jgi:molecular chaperone DnaK (HSP70)